MKNFLLLFVLSIAFISCGEPTPEEIVKENFKNYVDQNFDDPEDLCEIVSITVQDTSSYAFLIDMANKYIDIYEEYDSIYSKKTGAYLEELKKGRKKPLTQIQKQQVTPLFISNYNYLENNSLEFLESKEALKEILSLNDSTTDSIYYVNYEIKTRILVEGNKKIKSYYASVNKYGIIKFYNRKINKSDMPKKWQELSSAIDILILKFNKRKEYYKNTEKLYNLLESFK